MLKLVRLALTAAVLTAIAIRLRRRARLPERRTEPARTPLGGSVSSARMGWVWAGIAALVALVLTLALIPRETLGVASASPAPLAGATAAQGTPGVAVPTETSGPLRPATTAQATQPAATQPAVTPAPQEGGSACAPVSRPVAVRPIDPAVRRAVNRQWRRVERWLRANAPRTYRTLAGPARARTIAVAEAQMGVDFPDDLRASLLRHNGSRGRWAFGLGFWADGSANLGIRQIRDSWRLLCGRPSPDGWEGTWIPFLATTGPVTTGPVTTGSATSAPSYAVADATGGGLLWEGADGGMAPRMPSYYALVRAVADALEQGTPLDGRRPVVVRGVLRWQAENPPRG
ncbi:SMI1/KNR4 family protein [Nonomuraea bangladeshensis]|uniref:SMI1/KNR4 family protein n=1 Tax=Nonomuraea bangladeshensis TaxID=404385 RepID=UPI003C2DE7C8